MGMVPTNSWTGTSCKPADVASLDYMELLRWERRPSLRQPALVAAFEGWNDAGNAASEAVAYLVQAWGGTKFAGFDSEELFDFTSTRPQVKLESGETRRLEWPSISLSSASVPGSDRDVVFLSGPSPSSVGAASRRKYARPAPLSGSSSPYCSAPCSPMSPTRGPSG